MKHLARNMGMALMALALLYGSTTPVQALSFDGTGGVSLGTSVGNFGTADFNITLTIQTSYQGDQAVFTKRSGNSAHMLQMRIQENGSPVVEVRDDGLNPCCGYTFVGDGTQNVLDGSPHQLSLVRTGENLYVYVDGALASGTTYGVPFTLDLSSPGYTAEDFVLGGYPQYPDLNFRGQIDNLTINGVPMLNRPPVAVAIAQPSTANVGDLVTLDGGESYDPDHDQLSFIWKVKELGFTDNGDGTASFTPAAPGEYTFTLVVYDGELYSLPAQVVVTVPNRPPVAVAIAQPSTANVGDIVTLDGSASSDPDGSTGLQPAHKKGSLPKKGFALQYLWAQTGGPPVELPLVKPGFGSPAVITFQVTAPGVYTFSLVVNDGELDSVPDEVVVTVINPNQPPVANAGPDQPEVEATGPTTAVTLDGSASSDPDGDVLSYTWSENNSPIATGVTAQVGLGLGVHTLTLTVDDGQGGSASAVVVVNVVDTTPPALTLSGSNPLLLELGTPYTEPGASASDLVDGDLTASIQISGGVDSDTEDSYTVTYSVADVAGNTASASRTVQVLVTPNSYGLIATHSLHLRQSAQITSGFVGVVNQGQRPFLAGKVELVVGTRVQTGEDVRLSAPRVQVRQNATIEGELVYNQLVSVGKKATIAQQTQKPSSYFPLFQDKGLPAFRTGTPGSQDVEVKQKKSATLAAGAYDEVSVKQKGTLTFTGGTYHLGDLDVGPNAEIRFLAPTVLLIRGQLALDQGSTFGPGTGSGIDASDILVYVEGRNGRLGKHHDDDEGDDEEDDAEGRNLRKTPRAAKIGVRVVFQGNLYAPNGTIHLRQGSACVGSFIGKDVIVGVRTQVAAQSGWNTPGVIYQPEAPAPLAKLAGTENAAAALPNGTGLLANYPNPFNPSTTISYDLVEAAQVRLTIYNAMGQEVRELVAQVQEPGRYEVEWNGRDGNGQQVASGLYLYRLQAGDQIAVQKMLFAK